MGRGRQWLMRGRVSEANSDISCKPRNQRLSDGITEYKLWPYDQDLDDLVSTKNMRLKWASLLLV